MFILTADEIMERGLELMGYDQHRQLKVKRARNIELFRRSYGSNPVVSAAILQDLQTTEVEEARIDSQKFNLDHFLMALNWLTKYPTEDDRSGRFKFCVGRHRL